MNPNDPGKYDDLCTMVRENAGAVGAVVIVVGGNLGAGFSVQMLPEHIGLLPATLRQVADQIESQTRTIPANPS